MAWARLKRDACCIPFQKRKKKEEWQSYDSHIPYSRLNKN